MNPEPLKGKKILGTYGDPHTFEDEAVESGVEGLIKFHEMNIDVLISQIQEGAESWGYDYVTEMIFLRNMMLIRVEYESIMAIEIWLEDAI